MDRHARKGSECPKVDLLPLRLAWVIRSGVYQGCKIPNSIDFMRRQQESA